MKWIIDKIEDKLVTLENDTTKEIITIEKKELPPSIHEGSILIYKNNKYIEQPKEEEQRRKEITERFKKLRK